MTNDMPLNEETTPHVVLMLAQDMPKGIEDDLCAQLNIPDLNFMAVRRPAGPYAGMELYLPTAVALFITAGFFNGFLQKAGEDFYAVMKTAAQELWRRTRGIKFVAIGTPGKSMNRHYSLVYSITGEVVPGLRFKFLVRTEIDAKDADAGISAFLALISDIYNDRLEMSDCEALLTYRPVGGTVLVTYDTKQCRIVPVDAFEDRGGLTSPQALK